MCESSIGFSFPPYPLVLLYVKNPYGLNPALTRNYIGSHDNYVYYQINDDIFKLPKFTDPKYIKVFLFITFTNYIIVWFN